MGNAPEPSPVCNHCIQPCNVLSFDVTVDFSTGRQQQEHVSSCCKALYTMNYQLFNREIDHDI